MMSPLLITPPRRHDAFAAADCSLRLISDAATKAATLIISMTLLLRHVHIAY